MEDENIIEDLNDEDTDIIKKYQDTQKRLVSQKMDLYIPSLKDMIKNKTIDLDPKFQRRDRWNKKQQSKLIESVIMGVPIPPIFLAEEEYNSYTVMDGKQRLTAIKMYLDDEYALTGLTDWGELNGKKFSGLGKTIQNAITRRSISAIVILKESDLEIKFDVFERYFHQRETFAKYLRISGEELDGLAGIVEGHIPSDQLQRIREHVPRRYRRYPTGARDPLSPELREYMQQRNQG